MALIQINELIRSKKAFDPGIISAILFIPVFILMIAVQVSNHLEPKGFFYTKSGGLPGKPIKSEEYLYSHGEIVLKLAGNVKDPLVKIQINGDEAGSFSENEITLKVKQGDTLQVDASESGLYHGVIIESMKGAFRNIYPGKTFQLGRKLTMLFKVSLSDE